MMRSENNQIICKTPKIASAFDSHFKNATKMNEVEDVLQEKPGPYTYCDY